jgi:hypothetical protein
MSITARDMLRNAECITFSEDCITDRNKRIIKSYILGGEHVPIIRVVDENGVISSSEHS